MRLGFFVLMVERKGKIKIKISLINLFNKKLEGNFDKVLATFKFVAKTIYISGTLLLCNTNSFSGVD